MRLTLRDSLPAIRELFLATVPFVVLAVALLVLAYLMLDPAPPKQVTLATGQDQGAYAAFGKRYAEILKQNGIQVRLRPTAGAAENIALLREPGSGVDIAFVQGGADPDFVARGEDEESDGLISLGSLFYEPVWLFYRDDSAERLLKAPQLASLGQLAGWRVNIGAPGSGVPNLMSRLLEANQLDPAAVTLVREAQTPAVVALLDGKVDALVFASAPESLMVQMLLQTPGIRLFDFAQSEAYARRFPFLSAVTLPRGVVDLAKDLPPADVRLVAPTATLVAREGTHPALVQLFVQAAQQVHGGPGWFQKKGDFPSARNTERPLAKEAQRFYASGVPVLQRYLPFWLANLIDRMWPAILTIIAVLLPLSRILPPLYTFRIRSRVFRWYRQLRDVEEAIGRRPNEELLHELEAIEKRVAQVTVPLSYADELYSLRTHIHMVAERLIDPLAPLGAEPAR
ncbi:MAG: ABC transporter substrate-binding protein [Burkholderiales bacterium]|nr:ABC transporter substrate-binding protein [Burkholderiales bacterium]